MGTDGQRMSKSRGNVITPDELVTTYGADALRIYVMFMAPFDQDIAWSMEGIYGARRFLNRIWRLFAETYPGSAGVDGEDVDLNRLMHKTIRRVSERIEGFRYNTMVSILMEFVNALYECQRADAWRTASYHQALEILLILLAPSAPHIAEELWQLTDHLGSIHLQAWPGWDEDLAQDEMMQLPVQVNGKLRDVIEVASDASQDEVQAYVLALPKVQQYTSGRQVDRLIYVPGKVVNLVTH